MDESSAGMMEGRRRVRPSRVGARMPSTEQNAPGGTAVSIACVATATEALERVAAELGPGWHVGFHSLTAPAGIERDSVQ